METAPQGLLKAVPQGRGLRCPLHIVPLGRALAINCSHVACQSFRVVRSHVQRLGLHVVTPLMTK